MKTAVCILICLLTIGCSPTNNYWTHNINIGINPNTTDKDIEFILDAVEIVQPAFPYTINTVITDKFEDIRISIVSKKYFRGQLPDKLKNAKRIPAARTDTTINTFDNTIKYSEIIFVEKLIFKNTVIHELLHALGLHHSSNPKDIMFWEIDPYKEYDYKNDLDELKEIYK